MPPAAVIHNDGHGLHLPNNLFAIDHGDDTTGWYEHLPKGGSLVRGGERVAQGQKIAHSGPRRPSLAPHSIFQVTDTARTSTLPVAFADVDWHRGVPRMLFFCTSGNTVPK